MATITIDPATRLEGHLKVQLTSSGSTVTSAQSSGMLFRGFENLLLGKNPRDAVPVTQRVCGVCPISHAMASCLANEAAAGMAVTDNARIVRNLILGSNFIQSHVLHFYHLALLSYVQGPNAAPWTPSWAVDLRFSAADNQRMVDHYLQAFAIRRQAHEMASVFSGKMPHAVAYEPGGVTVVPKAEMITRFKTYLNAIISFVDTVYMPDVDLLSRTYPEYSTIGRGYGNLLAFGVFDLNASGSSKLIQRGRVTDGATVVQTVDPSAILEHASYSWYTAASGGLNPAQGVTSPDVNKAGAYSWLKAPRYGGLPYECGPLARMWVNGDYRHGISVMDRHWARAVEASKIAHAMLTWVDQLQLAASSYTPFTVPASGAGMGLTEAPRGALGHWLVVGGGTVSRYQILTPTCWNCSPRDDAGVAGPLEKALEGTPVADGTKPIEALRVVQSYDPCLACAVH